MRRSIWIFFAAILLPSLGLAWLAVHSVQDQQVVLEHQETIICQNITDALAKSIQAQMDQVRGEFVKTTQELVKEESGFSAQILAQNFDRKLRDLWPLAEIGFAVNLNGDIYSPKTTDGPNARIFRTENDRFLSNRENVEVYSSNATVVSQNSMSLNNAEPAQEVSGGGFSQYRTRGNETPLPDETSPLSGLKKEMPVDSAKDELQATKKSVPTVPETQTTTPSKTASGVTARAAQAPTAGREATLDVTTLASSSAPPEGATTDASATTSTHVPSAPAPAVTASFPVPAASTPSASPKPPVNMAENSMSAAGTPDSMSDSTITASSASASFNNAPQQVMKIQRNVTPQKMLAQQDTASLSNTLPEESDFRRVMGASTDGILARFLENKLRLMVWYHAADSNIVFGAQFNQSALVETLKASFQLPELERTGSFSRSRENNYCVAILDDAGHPAAISRTGFTADWKHPFVATEIGETLPHWEAALYLVDPQQITRNARTLQFTFGLIVLLLVAAIVSGGSLIAADVRRQVRVAQQKTDFVSNVSHELKTPLTSIRMFADLLAEKRVPDEERQATYLRIIAAEAARLTRLINNVLDFARLERGAPPGEHRSCDLVEAVRDVIETCSPHLEASGISFQHEIEAESLPITGDRDALGQIILNLVSNAEKYGGNDITVRVRRQETSSGALGCVDVLDRGPGIPARDVKTIFEAFHRLDDSLASGIPGSGLGLTLARRMARSHGGDVTCSARAGGGSCFTLSVPLVAAK